MMTTQHRYAMGFLIVVLLAAGFPVAGHATQWTIPVTVENAAGVSRQLELGIDPLGTPGLDPVLGEVGLPPWPPTSVFESRFLVDGLEGLYLDIRDDSTTERVHKIQIQEGAGSYPITLRWDAASLPAATFTMQDGYTGSLITAFDMAQTDSLVIPSSQSYIKRVDIRVIPGELPPGPPVITPVIPDQTVYLGQQFSVLDLDGFVQDTDNTPAEMTWLLTGSFPPLVTLVDGHYLSVQAPEGWLGSSVFNLQVSDPDGHQDDQDFTVTVLEPGLPSWSVGLAVTNASDESQALTLGIGTDATDGIDPALGEVALPPWPPSNVFDARFTLPDGLTQALVDVRPSAPGVLTYDLVWQSGGGGYPMTVTWPVDLPLGSFTIQDNLGGGFIPATDMSTVQSLVVPDSLSFITGLVITMDPVIDTEPPRGPDGLTVASWAPWTSVTLDWSAFPCTEEHFAYYEILFDTDLFTSGAPNSWDWSEDAALLNKATTSTTVTLPGPASRYVFRIRAWDAFGNAGSLSGWCVVGDVSGVDPAIPSAQGLRLLGNTPNPFNPLTNIEFELATGALVKVVIYDARGRLVRELAEQWYPEGKSAVIWDGKNNQGLPSASGFYLYGVEVAGQIKTGKMTLVR